MGKLQSDDFANRPPSVVLILFFMLRITYGNFLFVRVAFLIFLQNESGSAKDFPGDATDRRHSHPDEIERYGYETTRRYRSKP